jgi:hypothetical protein
VQADTCSTHAGNNSRDFRLFAVFRSERWTNDDAHWPLAEAVASGEWDWGHWLVT